MRPTAVAGEAPASAQVAAAKAQIARAAALVMVLFVASRAMGLAREMVISHLFGTSGDLDAYLAAFRLPDILFQLAAGGALASAFIPTFATHLAHGERRRAWRLASAVINLVLILTVALALLAALLAPWLVRLVIAPGFDPARQELTASLMRIMLVTPAIFGVSGVVMGILNAHQHFLLPALAPILYNAGIILGGVVLAPTWGVTGLAIGVVVGAIWHLLIQLPGLVRYNLRYTALLGLRDPSVHEVGRLMLPRVLGLAAVQLNFLVNTILASGLAPGSLSALNYAWLLMLLPQGVFAQAVATAAFPTFSTQVAKGQHDEMRSTLAATLRAVLYLALPAAFGLILLRGPLVQLIFQRGAFTATSTQLVAGALALYALGLPAHCVVEIAVRAFYAMHDTKTPVVISVAAMGLNVVLSLVLIAVFGAVGWPPYIGLALSNSVATTVEMSVLTVLLRRRLGGLEGGRMVSSLARMGLATAAMAATVGLVAWGTSGTTVWLAVPFAVAAGTLAYGGTSLAVRAPELRALLAMTRSKRRPPS